MKNKINETKPKWMDVYHEGKSVGCKCRNCFTRFGKSGSLSLKQWEHFGTLIPHSYYTENDKS